MSNNVYKYSVHEYDCNKVARDSGKIFVFDLDKHIHYYGRLNSTNFVQAFSTQMFETITTASGFTANIVDKKDLDNAKVIEISWRTPHWRLVKITEQK